MVLLSLCGLALALQAQGPAEANYDEAKVGAYTLPDPLRMADGRMVTDAAQWKRQRRPEIVRLFETEVYGRTAPRPARIEYEVVERDAPAFGGSAVRRQVTVWLAKDHPMRVLLYLPARRQRPVPVFLGMNFGGNAAVTTDPGVPLGKIWGREGGPAKTAPEESRGREASRWQIEMVLSRGYGVASVYYGDAFPDHKDGRKDSFLPKVQQTGKPDDWNAIGGWAWALSRALDYLEKDRDVDARRVAVWGHSRLGKTALWAGAMDERFAMVISNDSGEGGAALARRYFGETVRRINTAFPHWFADNFKQYNERVAELPVDQHMLLALVAPRPLYVASAVEDQWADPKGEFLAAKAAEPVYRLLGKPGLPAAEWPGIHQPAHGTIGYHIRAGKHDVTAYDWEQFLAFADQHWTKAKP